MDANLSGANLSQADLRMAYLRRANLTGTNLSGAWLGQANFFVRDHEKVSKFGHRRAWPLSSPKALPT
jgi:uncharacterized protein YjbI with pentapeptide repeats